MKRAGLLSVRGLIKRYGSIEVLRGVSFEVAPGEIFGLLGPNGAGKTTTLECILGLRRPDDGSIIFGDIDALAEPGRVKRWVGAQLQSASLPDKITSREALELFSAFYPQGPGAGDLLARFGLAAWADASFESLSEGQKRRLGLALAFVNDPRLIVLDEPTAGVDPLARRELRQMIIAARTAGAVIVISTHLIEEAHHLCDRVAIIDRGRIIASAPPDELIEGTMARSRIRRPTLEDVFLELTGRTWPSDPD